MAQQVGNAVGLARVLVSQEDEEVQTPVVIHGHLRVETERFAPWSDPCRSIQEGWKAVL